MGNPPLLQCLTAFSFMRHCASSQFDLGCKVQISKSRCEGYCWFLGERKRIQFLLLLFTCSETWEGKKKKRNCWKANYGSLCPIFLLHICCFQPCSFSELLLCCHSDNEPHCISSIFPPLPATNVTSICTCPWSILLSTSPSHPSTGHLPVSLTGWWA